MMLHTSKNKNNLYSIFKFDKNIEVSLAYFFCYYNYLSNKYPFNKIITINNTK